MWECPRRIEHRRQLQLVLKSEVLATPAGSMGCGAEGSTGLDGRGLARRPHLQPSLAMVNSKCGEGTPLPAGQQPGPMGEAVCPASQIASHVLPNKASSNRPSSLRQHLLPPWLLAVSSCRSCRVDDVECSQSSCHRVLDRGCPRR